jgi:hypothetical protein
MLDPIALLFGLPSLCSGIPKVELFGLPSLCSVIPKVELFGLPSLCSVIPKVELFYQSLSKGLDEFIIHLIPLAFFALANLRKQAFDVVSNEKSLSLS